MRLTSERGSLSVFLAFLLPVLILFMALVVDSANWFLHQRHLQIQADAGALAGAGNLQIAGCDASLITSQATRYAGLSDPAINAQLTNKKGTLSMTINKSDAAPCTSKVVDVEVSEANAPVLIKLLNVAGLNLVKSARVEINQITDFTGTLPILLEDDNPQWVRLSLVDEDTGVTIKEVTDTSASASGVFDGAFDSIFMNHINVGVRVAIGYSGSSTNDDCTSPRVDCFDGEAGSQGLSHIHGFPQPLTGVTTDSPPALKKVWVTPTGAGCTTADAYVVSSGCQVVVRATIDFVDGLDLGDGKDVDVTGTIGGTAITLTHGTGEDWASAPVTLSTAGAQDIKLNWKQRAKKVSPTQTADCDTGKGQKPAPCTGVFRSGQALGASSPATATAVHRVYVLESGSSIRFLRVSENGASGANSFDSCLVPTLACARNLVISIGLPQGLKLGDRAPALTDPSNKGLLECDANGNPEDQIAQGCKRRYELYSGPSCDISTDPEPWNCAEGKTGTVATAIEKGMIRRIYFKGANVNPLKPNAADCASHKNFFAAGSGHDPLVDSPPADDTRIVSVVLARRGITASNGKTEFPITDFATLYVTGFSDTDPCKGTTGPNETSTKGGLVGYFIKYVHPNDGDGWGTTKCVDTSLGGCVPIMTR